MSTILTFLLIGILCVAYNKPVAQEIGKVYLAPVKWLFGERKWVINSQRYFVIWARITLYFGALISLAIILLEVLQLFS